jgi:HNH endonuclease
MTTRWADRPMPLRLLMKFKVSDGCWEWQAGMVQPQGYGAFMEDNHSKRHQYAHRAVYQLFVGAIPEGLTLDHLCRNRRCVRPDHLEPVSNAENLRRGIHRNSEKRVCPNGHPYDSIGRRSDNGHTFRACKTCVTARNWARRGAPWWILNAT